MTTLVDAPLPPAAPPAAHSGTGAPVRKPGRLGRLVRGRPDDPSWVRPALIGLLIVTAGLYLWDLSASGWANSFYSAAVEAGTKSWKAFFFGSFDPSNFITVDKPPASLWVMEISTRVFGVHPWSILVPNALEGVATVGVLYLTVRRWFGPVAGLASGAVVAFTPVAALMFRYNNPDALLVLLLTLAAYATVRALEAGSTRWVALAGTLVGFAFLTKMLQALLVVPAIGLVYLLAAPVSLRRRIVQLLWGAIAMVASAGWWVLTVQLVPAADRPYVGGSQDNSLLNLIFGYNGFGRLTGNETGSVGGGAGSVGRWGPTGLTRLFGADMGSQISWLLPAALIFLVAGLLVARRAPRTHRGRAAMVLWGGWLLVTGVTLSLSQGIIHPYYTVALAPAIGALVGIGGTLAWSRCRNLVGRGLLSATVAVTSVWSYVLLGRTPTWLPELRVAVLVAGLAAAGATLAWPHLHNAARAATLALALAAAGAGSAAFTLETVVTPHAGAIPSAGPATIGATAAPGGFGGGPTGGTPTPGTGAGGRGTSTGGPGGGNFGPPPGLTPGGGTGGGTGAPLLGTGGTAGAAVGRPTGGIGGLLNGSTPGSAVVRLLDKGAAGYRWVAATVGSNQAAGYQLATDEAIMALGGFNGTDPAPTLSQFEAMVAAHEVHYFIAGGSGGGPGGAGGGVGGAGGGTGAATSITSSKIASWVESHFSSETAGGVTLYDLSAPTS